MKAKKPAVVSPEYYFLEEGPKIRDTIKAKLKAVQASNQALLHNEVRAELKKRGVSGPLTKGLEVKYGDRLHGRMNGVDITFELAREVEAEVLKRVAAKKADESALERQRKFLCSGMTPTNGRRFGAFCRTKYGRNLDGATVAKAFGEWVELNSACTC